MEQENILRQEAIRMHLQGESAHAISTRINRSRQWVYKWIAPYEQDPHGNWYLSESNAPKNASYLFARICRNNLIHRQVR
jgi:transposase